MRIAFAHHEPIEPGRARWVAMVRTVAAVAERAPVTWYTPDSEARVREFAAGELGLALPSGLHVVTLRSLHRRFGLTLNSVFFRACARAVAELQPQVLWLRSDKLAAHIARAPQCPPLVYEAHLVGELWTQDRGGGERKARRLHELESRIYARAGGVAAITRGLLDEIQRLFGYRGPAAVVPSAVDTGLFQPLWQGGDSRTVAYAGTLQFWKGLDTLLHAMALAPGLRLRVVGGGKPEEEAALRKLARELCIEGRLELRGRVPQRELPALLAGCACAVHPLPAGHAISERYTSPLKLFEYMALGMPIVAPDLPSVREVLRDSHGARLYGAGDPAALARALQEVCGDVALARSLGAAALRDAQGYTYGARAERLLELFGRAAQPAQGLLA